MTYRYCIMLFMLVTFFTQAKQESDEKAIRQVLDGFHQAAANAQTERYFNLLADDAIFLGTDANERWTKLEFKRFVEPYFTKGKGWLYVPQQRNVSIVKNAQVAFFDELLTNVNYGLCRGSGVLINTKNGWKISQYNLSVPLPNDLAKKLVQQIKEFQENSLQEKK